MTRAKISEYSATANDNTDVNGVDIAEGCPPSSMNNMGREIMAALKRFQVGSDGDGVTVGGALVVSGATTIANTATLGNVDINGGTIDGTTIGGASAAAGTFTTLTASSPSVISVNSASDALRITQVGSGNALVVEDSANPDATPVVVDSGGNVVIGNTVLVAGVATGALQVQGTGVNGSSANFQAYSSTTGGTLEFDRSRGSLGLHTVVQSGDRLGRIFFSGSDGAAFIRGAEIFADVDGTPGTNDMPGRLIFSTTADGASTPTERMRIDNAGNVGIGVTPSAGRKLEVRGNATGSTAVNFVMSAPVIQSDVTGTFNGFLTFPSTAASAFTLVELRHFSAAQNTFGATSTVTNQYGFRADSSLTSATNNFGFRSDIASGTGRWNFYANGTADNFFAGQVQLGAGTVSAPALSTTGDTNTGIFFPAADTIAFAEGGAEAMRIDSNGNVGIGTSSPSTLVDLAKSNTSGNDNQMPNLFVRNTSATQGNGASTFNQAGLGVSAGNTTVSGGIRAAFDSAGPFGTGVQFYVNGGSNPLQFYTNGTERMRIDPSGNLLVGKTTTSGTSTGMMWINGSPHAYLVCVHNDSTSGNAVAYFNRQNSDGTIIALQQADTVEGTISVSGTTVSYNGGHLSRWAQMLTKPDLLKGTVMSNLDEMNVYIAPTTYWTEEDELPVDEEGNPTVAVGDVKVETHEVQNEQLNKVKVSDVEGDANVAGVFVNWTYDEAHSVDEINMAMTGDMIIRIAEGVTVARGDLLMSAGDGTAKPQGDDIVRSKTIAKVTSTHVTCTYDDGSYCVPCVLMAC